MKHPILLNIKKQFPGAIEKDGAPANCLYRIPYAEKKHWQTDIFRIVEQDYDGTHAYLGHIEIKAKKRFSFIITTTASDLFWLYMLQGGIKIRQHPSGMEPNGFLDELEEGEYALLYSPPRRYEITIEPGLHVLFFFVVNSIWLQRHPVVEPTHFQQLIGYLRHQKDYRSSTKVLQIHDEINKEILHLLTMRDFGEMRMDAKIYIHIIRLILISREDLKKNGIVMDQNMRQTLEQVRNYYKDQISEGNVPVISEVAEHFKIRVRQLRDEHKAAYGHSLQSYITRKRMEKAEILLLETEETISNIAYNLEYELDTFQKQFRTYFGLSASEYRKRYK